VCKIHIWKILHTSNLCFAQIRRIWQGMVIYYARLEKGREKTFIPTNMDHCIADRDLHGFACSNIHQGLGNEPFCIHKLCAYILMTVNLTLSGAVLMMVFFDRGFQYQGFLIYVIAMYAFYITVTAVIDMIKYRKYKSPILSITKVIKMASALFSMLFLETAMFAQFGAETSPKVKRLMIMLTGAGISIAVVSMAIFMIVQTTKEIKEIRSGTENGKS